MSGTDQFIINDNCIHITNSSKIVVSRKVYSSDYGGETFSWDMVAMLDTVQEAKDYIIGWEVYSEEELSQMIEWLNLLKRSNKTENITVESEIDKKDEQNVLDKQTALVEKIESYISDCPYDLDQAAYMIHFCFPDVTQKDLSLFKRRFVRFIKHKWLWHDKTTLKEYFNSIGILDDNVIVEQVLDLWKEKYIKIEMQDPSCAEELDSDYV